MINQNDPRITRYIDTIIELDLFPSKLHNIFPLGATIMTDLRFLFGDCRFEGKTMIDIGAGTGVYSCFAALMGARFVLGLEPEAEGSTKVDGGSIACFRNLVSKLSLENVEIGCGFRGKVDTYSG